MSTESVNGYQLAHWYASGMEWWAVSDMNASELTEFARILAQSPALPNSP
jgi:anti-sigma factor RsiW